MGEVEKEVDRLGKGMVGDDRIEPSNKRALTYVDRSWLEADEASEERLPEVSVRDSQADGADEEVGVVTECAQGCEVFGDVQGWPGDSGGVTNDDQNPRPAARVEQVVSTGGLPGLAIVLAFGLAYLAMSCVWWKIVLDAMQPGSLR